MTIRFATEKDIPSLLLVGQRMHALTRFRRFDFNAEKAKRACEQLIASGQKKYAFLVATDSANQVVGGLIGVLEQHIFSDQLTASIMHFDVLPEARAGGHGVRLLKAFEQWAANRRVVEISFGINSGEELEKLARFAQRMGYTPVGDNFVKTPQCT